MSESNKTYIIIVTINGTPKEPMLFTDKENVSEKYISEIFETLYDREIMTNSEIYLEKARLCNKKIFKEELIAFNTMMSNIIKQNGNMGDKMVHKTYNGYSIESDEYSSTIIQMFEIDPKTD